MSIARNIDARSVKSLQALPVMANMGRRLEVTRSGPRQLILRDPRRSGARPLDIRALSAGSLAQAREIGAETSTSRYVVSEEIVATKPSLTVRVLVRRYDRGGRLTGVVNVPLDGLDVVPHDFITVDGRGVVRALVPTEGGVKIRKYEFVPPPDRRHRLGERELKQMGRAIQVISVDTDFVYPQRKRGSRKRGVRFAVKVPTPSISRAQVVKNADGFLTVNWVLKPENFSNPVIENRCEPRTAKFWRRPYNLTPSLIGTTIGPMPYKWGGGDTPQSFKARLEWGALAGDICTCRNPEIDYCLTPESAGVDCSGFISSAWGIGKRGTSGLLDVANDVSGLADLKPGDAFDWPGHHVRMFVGMASGPEVGFTVLEASTRIECEGVCRRTYRPSELNGYRLIRYKGITE